MSELKFKYKFEDSYNPKYANGAYGGISPKGEIVINFFLERLALPVSQTFAISENGNLQLQTAEEPLDLKKSVIRYVENGVILNLESAKVIATWLNGQINELERKLSSEELEK